MEKFLGLPPLASAHGAEIDHLIGLFHWLMLILAVGWGFFFIYTLVRFRAGANPKANYHGMTSHFSTYLEIAVAVIEIILLVGFSMPFWANNVAAVPSETEALHIRVIAEQFAWNIHYPGPDGKFGRTDFSLMDAAANPVGLDRNDPAGKDDVTTVNDLTIPVNTKIVTHITSKDVIHSFFLPVMRVKHDAIPGQEVPVWFEPIQTGAWEIACAQLCGLGHYTMKGNLTVVTQDEFKAWLTQHAPTPAEGGGGDSFWQ